MATKIVAMGEETGRKTPNVVVSVRDNGAELLQKEIIPKLELVTTNAVDDKEAIEGICGEVLHSANLLLRVLERVGAQTRPEIELENFVSGRQIGKPVYQHSILS